MKRYWETLKKVVFELVIVFVGVFLAFQLNNYRENLASDEIRIRYYNQILLEFRSNLQEIEFAKRVIASHVDTFQVVVERGEQPALVSLNTINLDNNLFVIKSAFESGYLENLNPQFVTNISVGSNYITRAARLIDRFNDTVALAMQGNDWQQERFYDAEGLKPEYQWYITDLQFIVTYLGNLESAMKDGAIPDIERIIQEEG